MSTTTSTTPRHGGAPPAGRTDRLRVLLYAGLATSVLVTVAPFVDLYTVDTIGDHVRSAYPRWPDHSIAADRNAIVGYLAVVGILGIAGWILTIRLLRRGSRHIRVVASSIFAVGALVSLSSLSLGGEHYSTIVPVLHGVLGVLPPLVGAAVVVRLWRRS